MTEKQDRKNKYDQRLKIITYDIAIRVLLEVVFLVFASHLTFTMLSPTLFTPPPHFHKSYGMPGNSIAQCTVMIQSHTTSNWIALSLLHDYLISLGQIVE